MPTATTLTPVTKDSAETEARRRGRPRDVRCDQAILRATLDMLIEGGAVNLSIDGVAARAGVGKATIYRRWSSKEALVLEALGSDDSMIEITDTGTLRGDLDSYFEVLLQRFQADQGSDVLPHLIEAACYDPEVRRSLDEYTSNRRKPLLAALQRAKRRGEIGNNVDLDVLIDVLVGPFVYRRLLTGGKVDRVFIRKLLDIVF